MALLSQTFEGKDKTQGVIHVRRILCHWVPPPSLSPFCQWNGRYHRDGAYSRMLWPCPCECTNTFLWVMPYWNNGLFPAWVCSKSQSVSVSQFIHLLPCDSLYHIGTWAKKPSVTFWPWTRTTSRSKPLYNFSSLPSAVSATANGLRCYLGSHLFVRVSLTL